MALHTLTEEAIRNRVNLTHNNLEDVKSLSLPGSYQEKVTSLGQSLCRFTRLKQLDLSRNSLSSLSGLEYLKMLEKLNLYYNNIKSLVELSKLQNNCNLQDVDLRLNPVTRTETDYRLYLIQLLPNLQKLDDRCVRDRERQAAIMHFSDSPEFDVSKNEKPDPPQQANPRAKFVKDFVGVRTLDMDEMAVLDLLAHTRNNVVPTKPLTGSTARLSTMEEYSFEALKQLGMNEKASGDIPKHQELPKERSSNLNKEFSEGTFGETLHSLPQSESHGTILPPKCKSVSQNNEAKRAISLPITHEEEYQAYTKYTGYSHYTPCPDSNSTASLTKNNEPTDSNNNNNTSMVYTTEKRPENKMAALKDQPQHFERIQQAKNGHSDQDNVSVCSQSSQKISLNGNDRFLLQLMDLIDKYWNGTQSLQRNAKFKSLAKDLVEKHLDNCVKHFCKGYQEEIFILRKQKGELIEETTQRQSNSSETKMQNSLKKAYENLEMLNGKLEEAVQENQILRQKLAEVESKSKSENRLGTAEIEEFQKEKADLQKNVKILETKLKQFNQIQTLADMLQESHNSLIRTNNHLMSEIEESKARHSSEVHQLQWNYEQLRQIMGNLDFIPENSHRETGSLLSLNAESMDKPSVKLYDSDERESMAQ